MFARYVLCVEAAYHRQAKALRPCKERRTHRLNMWLMESPDQTHLIARPTRMIERPRHNELDISLTEHA